MRSRSAAILALGILTVGDAALMAQPRPPRRGDPQEAARYGWLWSLEEGKAQARKSGKPIMVVLRCVP
jgi:hypothetical protein